MEHPLTTGIRGCYYSFMTKRTDLHRPAAIIPAEYTHLFSYNGGTSSGGHPVPSYGITCELDRRVWASDERGNRVVVKNGEHDANGLCCCVGLVQSGKRVVGDTCKCTVCGVNFVYGDVWHHGPTNEYIHMGHTCADKYSLLTDRSAFELRYERMKAATARELQKQINAEKVEAFYADHPGLREALQTDHRIVKDIAERFQQYKSMSDKQIALVFKISEQAKQPPAEKEKTVLAPIVLGKRQTFEGVVVSTKMQDGAYGTQYKMTVKVTTPEGVWLAWGTCPSQLLSEVPNTGDRGRLENLRGAIVSVTATLKPGKDLHFAITNRPVAKIVKQSPLAIEEVKNETV